MVDVPYIHWIYLHLCECSTHSNLGDETDRAVNQSKIQQKRHSFQKLNMEDPNS